MSNHGGPHEGKGLRGLGLGLRVPWSAESTTGGVVSIDYLPG